jgi:hypothetical protein
MKTNKGVKKNHVREAGNLCVESCQKLTTQINQAKKSFHVELGATPELPDRIFRQALNEASALAWQTGYPLLLFPDLAAEKIETATAWNARQKALRQKISVPEMSN